MSPVHLAWHVSETMEALGDLVRQRTVKTYCGRRALRRNVTSLTKAVDCPECRARYAADLRSSRAASRAMRALLAKETP